MIANLNTRLNAIRTLESRISLIKSYLSSISSSSKDEAGQGDSTEPATPALSHPTLRNINSLITHLSLLNPEEQSDFSAEMLAQHNDVLLVSLLGQLGQSIKGMRELGKKSAIVQNVRQSAASRGKQLAMQSRFDSEYFTGRDAAANGGMYT